MFSAFPLGCFLEGAITNVPLRARQSAEEASHVSPPLHGQMSSAPH